MNGSDRDFDRIARAWLERGPNEAPDRAVAAALQVIDTTPQVRRPWRWPLRRDTPMPRLPLLAALVGLVILSIGALLLSGGGPQPAPVPDPTVGPSLIASPAASPAASLGDLPDALIGGWVAPSRGTTIENLTEGGADALGGNSAATTIMLVNAGDADFTVGPAFWLERRGTPLLQSKVTEESPGVLRFEMATSADPNCVGRDSGTYRWSQTADGQWLTLELIEDACETRGEILAGTWQRSLAHDSTGGPGISAVLEPFMTFTLPLAGYEGWGLGGWDEMVVDSQTATYKVWKDLDGFVDPCDIDQGRLDIEPGMDALVAYFETDPRFEVVRRDEFEIDGHRAVELEYILGSRIAPPCWTFDGDPDDRRGVLTWAPSGSWEHEFWNGAIGDRGPIVITEVEGATLAFEFAKPSGDQWVVDREVLDSVRFLDALPAPPAG